VVDGAPRVAAHRRYGYVADIEISSPHWADMQADEVGDLKFKSHSQTTPEEEENFRCSGDFSIGLADP
jgi:hypothetical protein